MMRTIGCRISKTPLRLVCAALLILCGLAGSGIGREATAGNNWREPRMNHYVNVPPFISYSVKPNILILLDNSGSMNERAYGGSTYAGTPSDTAPTRTASFFVEREWDDVHENLAGAVSDEEILSLGSHQVGMRFQNMEIPQGAIIRSARITFIAAADGAASGMRIIGENADNAPAFDDTQNGNLSNRAQTSAVGWNTASWTAGTSYDTPDLSAIVQAIVSRTGWQKGNAMVLGITGGSGDLQAQARLTDLDDPTSVLQIGPVLHVTFDSAEPGERYYGYFNPDFFYAYNHTSGYFEARFEKRNYDLNNQRWNVKNRAGTSTTLTDTDIVGTADNPRVGFWDGNWLNWMSMRRIDVLRKVLVGGRLHDTRAHVLIGENDARDGVPDAQYSKDHTNSAHMAVTPLAGAHSYTVRRDGTFLVRASSSNYAFNIHVQKEREIEPQDFFLDPATNQYELAGVLQRVGDQARWGNMWFNRGIWSDSPGYEVSGGHVAHPVDNGISDAIVDDLRTKRCESWTPLGESYYVALQYFKQQATVSGFGSPFQVNDTWDPMYHNDLEQHVACGKNFVLLLTDGASTQDTQVPSAFRGYAGNPNNIPEEFINYTHFDPLTSGKAYPSNGREYLADLALFARHNDLRGEGEYACYNNNIVLYTVVTMLDENHSDYANAKELLLRASYLGGYGDSNNDGIPDTYYESKDGYHLEKELMKVFGDMLKNSTSATAASVESSSRSGEGAIYQTIFYPSLDHDRITWAGQVNALLVDAYGNMREDTNANRKLDDEDLILVLKEPVAPTAADICAAESLSATFHKYLPTRSIHGGGPIEPDWDKGPQTQNGQIEFGLNEVRYLWSSNDWLNANGLTPELQRNYHTNSHQRYIFTFVDADGAMVPNA
ncbi:MAG: hypothetical protein KFF50_08700, partial [Desulfatitalea sp.]|nr:hypothetical protein [Desulfatitalea sp.]